jgi:hypothetical protein
MELLESFTEGDLDKPSHAPPERQSHFSTYRECLLMLTLKWMMHRGNVADAKRAAGR